MKEYTYDIAISLCKQDMDFARKLVKALNPRLNVFFYEDRQEELISKSGPEAFGKIFKEQSRVVVVLSRNEWSESYYTDIERNAIIDRTSVKNQGYSFLIVIPMEQGEAPSWYPSTKIYADPRKFSIELLAKFIEFKVTEEGGVVTPLTSEEYSAFFINQLKEKQKITQLQNSNVAIEKLKSEADKLKMLFNSKAEYFNKNRNQISSTHKLFTAFLSDASFGVAPFLLSCEIHDMDYGIRLVSAQQPTLFITLFRINNQSSYEQLKSEQYKYYYSGTLNGWAQPVPYRGNDRIYISHLFTEYGHSWYDLKHPVTTEELIDKWFIELWTLVKQEYKLIL